MFPSVLKSEYAEFQLSNLHMYYDSKTFEVTYEIRFRCKIQKRWNIRQERAEGLSEEYWKKQNTTINSM